MVLWLKKRIMKNAFFFMTILWMLFLLRITVTLMATVFGRVRQADPIRLYVVSYTKAIKEIGLETDGIDCDLLMNGNVSKEVERVAKQWTYDIKRRNSLLSINKTSQRCHYLKAHYGFNMNPLSDEERDFPLAYGILVHKQAIQVYYMMSAFYQPQNEYCMAVDGGSTNEFKRLMSFLEECFPNIHVTIVPNVHYCGYSVLTAVYTCLQLLSASKKQWKYYQNRNLTINLHTDQHAKCHYSKRNTIKYAVWKRFCVIGEQIRNRNSNICLKIYAGVDLPLKTNREMVRIFKRLNGSFNSEVKKFQMSRVRMKEIPPPYGVELFKSSLSATFSRRSADFIVQSQQVRDILLYLNGTFCPDESFWTTIAGNPDKIPMPGSFDAANILENSQRYSKLHQQQQHNANATEDVSAIPQYISRFQSWITNPWKSCKGKYVSSSCVFGVGDISSLLRRPQLVAHKFYLSFEPAAFFCIYQKVRERALQNIEKFNDTSYGDLPGPRITRSESVEEWFKKNLQ